ncbi:glycosyl hydrolase family 28-related protein [Coraliomargarita parva]|uniref:glycosyl hydrolase family 28-related protein n=1 Tax=Coraliomargarita parva TaxID=3014050 RepID=UPI0022B2C28D|nr:glycosyl hydrolase family 28-related protein [Coraliomargarita parva]
MPYKTTINRSGALIAFILCFLSSVCLLNGQQLNVKELGLTGDGEADDTAALQAALDAGKNDLYFPEGNYKLGTVKIPSDSNLTFNPKAKITINADAMEAILPPVDVGNRDKPIRPLFVVNSERVVFQGLRFDYGDSAVQSPRKSLVNALVYCQDSDTTRVSDFHVELQGFDDSRDRINIIMAADSHNITLEDSSAYNISNMIWATQCRNVTVRGNSMIKGGTITTFAWGGENLKHHDNWSRGVTYQCAWRGGSPDPSRKAPKVPLGTASVVHRGSKPSDPDYVPHTSGIYDVMVKNNYAEYGVTLCWGNKARQVVVEGNIARFMWDYSYGSEGDENVIYANNVSINSAVGGITCLYYGEKVLISGNTIIVTHEPFIQEYTKHPESKFLGQFIRVHHGQHNPEDRYGNGSMLIEGNLFVNELENRPSGISLEAGRDVMFSNNKVVNGLLRKSDEIARVKVKDVGKDADEFASQDGRDTSGAQQYVYERRVGADKSRITIMGNEFISRQPGDKAQVLVNGSVSSAIIKDNVFRKEATFLEFTEEQRALEQEKPRYMLYSEEDFDNRDLTNSNPATAIGIDAYTPVNAIVQGNIIEGWKHSITAANTTTEGKTSFVVSNNTVDGDISVTGDSSRTSSLVDANIQLPLAAE